MRACIVVSFVLAAFTAGRVARAAGPKVAECLAATETSLTLSAQHKLRAARAQLLVCSAASCPVDVRAECAHRIDELNAAVPTVVFAVKTAAGRELSAVKVMMDGEVVADHLDGSALALEPGTHEFTFETAGEPLWKATLLLHEGEKNRHEPIVIGGTAPTAPPPSDGSNTRHHTQRLAAFVVGGAGVAGVVVGSIFGTMTFAEWSAVNSLCSQHSDCPNAAVTDHNTTVTYGVVSTAGFIAGGVLLAAGLTLYFTAPKDNAPTVGLQIAPHAMGLAGRF
jgi:hypothetical protein